LSLAFSNVNSIKLIVKLNKYKDKLFEGSKSGEINEALSVENIHIIDIEAGLVTGADEVIKNVLREVY
jgi:phosphatidylinositol-4,5-bisphosphate 3-kinase